jgi:hypothetical protein
MPARWTAIASCTRSTSRFDVVKLFARKLKSSVTESAVVTYPDSDRTLSMVPVFACTFPCAGVFRMRFEIVPSTPATGSAW